MGLSLLHNFGLWQITKRVVLFLFFIVVLSSNLSARETIRVAVAANFAHTAKSLAEDFMQQHPIDISISSGSSGTLYAQIVRGAPFDVFLSADAFRPKRLEDNGLIVLDSRQTYARGLLALWVNEQEQVKTQDMFFHEQETTTPSIDVVKSLASALETESIPLIREVLKSSSRISIANPKTAPYGEAAQTMLQRLDLWEDLQGRIVTGNNVLQAFQFKQTGNVDTAIVAHHLLSRESDLIVIPQHLYEQIQQQLVIIKSSNKQKESRLFVDYLLSEEVQNQLHNLGYAKVGS